MKFAAAIIVIAAIAAAPAAAQAPAPWPGQTAEPPAQATAPWPGAQPAAQPPAGPSPFDQPQGAAPPEQPWPAPAQQPPRAAGPDPWSGGGAAQQQPPQQDARSQQCLETFMTLRKDVEKHGGAIQSASARKEKPSAKEACGLFNSFTSAEKKMYAYAAKNQANCGIPAQIVDNMKQARAKSDEIRNRVCQAAAQGPAQPRAPSLSDALSAPAPDSSNIRTGRGTFDTLTGNPLTR